MRRKKGVVNRLWVSNSIRVKKYECNVGIICRHLWDWLQSAKI